MGKSEEAKRAVVFITFETEFARCGGLGAVMTELPKEMVRHEECIVLAPYFRNITDLEKYKREGQIEEYGTALSFCILIRGMSHTVEVRQITQQVKTESGLKALRTYLLSADGFFTAPSSPYMNPCDPKRQPDPYRNPVNPDRLTEDALFFSAVVPRALVELSKAGLTPSRNLILHLQDWETACVAKALEMTNTFPAIRSSKCVLTLHNPYDRYLSPKSSGLVSDLVSHLGLRYDNVLAQTIGLVSGPLSTVSETFASELMGDPLHTIEYAPHLQDKFGEKGIVGINNGRFKELDFPKSAIDVADAGDLQAIVHEKRKRRNTLVNALQGNTSGKMWGNLGNLTGFEGPIFLMFGRDDPRQKGYDVAAEAIRNIPEGKAKYIFTPIPGDEGLVGLGFLKSLAEERDGEVKVFLSRMAVGFNELLRGCTFLIMPSLYEPFGAAVEAYAVGTPVVARATGGLIQQVVPYPDSASTGFLFKERVSVQEERQGWRKIIKCDYWNLDPKGDRITDRRGCRLFDSMVAKAADTLKAAIEFYTSDLGNGQLEYARMIHNGFGMLDRFSWADTIRHYQSSLYRNPA